MPRQCQEHWRSSDIRPSVYVMCISAVPQHCVSRSLNGTVPYQNVFHMHLEGFSWNYCHRHDPSTVKWGRWTENISALNDFVKKLRTWKDGGNLEGENEKNQQYRLRWRWKGHEMWVKRRTDCKQTARHFGTEFMERPVVWHRFLT
jgi:hypothetical protein